MTRCYVLLLVLAGTLWASASAHADVQDYPADWGSLRMNETQAIGSHNSYHLRPSEALDALMVSVLSQNLEAIAAICPGDATSEACIQRLRYDHPSVDVQLDGGIRQFEFDVFWDPFGYHYSRPVGWLFIENFPPLDVLLGEDYKLPGFKTLHIQDLDYETNCVFLTQCLQPLRDWSLLNQNHAPILVLIETKDAPLPTVSGITFTAPYLFTSYAMLQLEQEIQSVFSADHILTPDDVRGSYDTLREAILEVGWPSLDQASGKILFALDNGDPHRSLYLANHPGLKGALMFVDSSPADDFAAFMKRNDPAATDVSEQVRAGFLIRTRADVETQEALANDTTRRDRAFESGAQFISTDYRWPDLSLSPYKVAFEGDATLRENPVNAPPACSFEGDLALVTDTDQDGKSDRLDCDDDGDFLVDGFEAQFGTDPLLEDSDQDGASDSRELFFGTDPLSASSVPAPEPAAAWLQAAALLSLVILRPKLRRAVPDNSM